MSFLRNIVVLPSGDDLRINEGIIGMHGKYDDSDDVVDDDVDGYDDVLMMTMMMMMMMMLSLIHI